MRVLIQRVDKAKVRVEGNVVAEIASGFLLFIGIAKGDDSKDLEYLATKVLNLRIFPDSQGRMNLNIQQVNGQILSVSQFTLCADTRKGNRPGFDNAAEPDVAEKLWLEFNQLLKKSGIDTKEGVFGALMDVELTNNGPATIWLDSRQ